MKKIKILLFFLLSFFLLGLFTLYFAGVFNPKGAGLLIETVPQSVVYVDGEQVGKTPLDKVFDPGEVTLKLVPESFDAPLAPYEAKVKLVSGVKTVVNKKFAESEALSSGNIVSFEKISGDEATVSIVSIPDSAKIAIDGVMKGYTPYSTSKITVGEHSLNMSSEGYVDRKIDIVTRRGYRLILFVKLEPERGSLDDSPDKEAEEDKNVPINVKILATPVGYLRVRSEPTTFSEEVGRVDPGNEYLLVEKDEETGWYKIEYEEGKEGWVSGEYAEIVEQTDENDADDNSQKEERSGEKPDENESRNETGA